MNITQEQVIKAMSTPDMLAMCEFHGFKIEALSIVRFLDKCEDARWFMRNHEIVAYIGAITEGGRPIDLDVILAQVREDFGAGVSLICA